MTAAERHAWLSLLHTPGVGGATLRKLLQQFGDPESVLAVSVDQLARHVPSGTARAIRAGGEPARIQQSLAWLDRSGHHLITLADPAYPSILFDTVDPPPVLFARGRLDWLNRPALAIVGSRNASRQGERDAESFARELAAQDLVIVSGLALGIDAAAHRGALASRGGTIAVIGTGPDTVYPARNRDLALAIAESGLLLSEFPPGTPALAGNFPRRNRIISGLSLGCLVIEAGLDSGSLITARLAAEQGREVFAIPGSIHSPLSRGCHRLIREGAKLVESAADVVEELRLPGLSDPPLNSGSKTLAEHPLLVCMGFAPLPLDALVERSGLTAQEVSAILLEKELAGEIASLPGGLFQRLV